MLDDFQPDCRHIVDAALNRRPQRVPLYEHGFGPKVMEQVLGKPFWQMMMDGSLADKVEAYRRFCEFGIKCGYDVIPVEFGACLTVQGGEALCGRASGLFRSLADVRKFPWDEMTDRFAARCDDQYRALALALPPGMKAVGGVGNGIFETAQDFLPLAELAMLRVDDPEAYALPWQKVGDMFLGLWTWLLDRHADAFAVCRMGDDLGYKSFSSWSRRFTDTEISETQLRSSKAGFNTCSQELTHQHCQPAQPHDDGQHSQRCVLIAFATGSKCSRPGRTVPLRFDVRHRSGPGATIRRNQHQRW